MVVGALLCCAGVPHRSALSATGRTDAARLQGDGGQRSVEGRHAERRPAEGQVVGDVRRSAAERARGQPSKSTTRTSSRPRRTFVRRAHSCAPTAPITTRRSASIRRSRRPIKGRTPVAAAGGTSQSFSIPGDVTWEPDLWGRVRLSVENATSNAQVSAAELENVRLSQQALLAVDYFSLAAERHAAGDSAGHRSRPTRRTCS